MFPKDWPTNGNADTLHETNQLFMPLGPKVPREPPAVQQLYRLLYDNYSIFNQHNFRYTGKTPVQKSTLSLWTASTPIWKFHTLCLEGLAAGCRRRPPSRGGVGGLRWRCSVPWRPLPPRTALEAGAPQRSPGPGGPVALPPLRHNRQLDWPILGDGLYGSIYELIIYIFKMIWKRN